MSLVVQSQFGIYTIEFYRYAGDSFDFLGAYSRGLVSSWIALDKRSNKRPGLSLHCYADPPSVFRRQRPKWRVYQSYQRQLGGRVCSTCVYTSVHAIQLLSNPFRSRTRIRPAAIQGWDATGPRGRLVWRGMLCAQVVFNIVVIAPGVFTRQLPSDDLYSRCLE